MLHQAWKMVLNNLTKFFWLPTAAVFFSSFEEEVQARQFLSYSLLDFFSAKVNFPWPFFEVTIVVCSNAALGNTAEKRVKKKK